MTNSTAATADAYIARIREKVNFLRADLRSYVFLRSSRGWSSGNHGLGGGNVTSTLASFTLLNLLSKTYLAVTNPGAFTLRSDPETEARCESCGRRRRLHEVNELDAFVAFVKWLRDRAGVALGISDDESRQVWNEFRNWLAHRFDTKHIAVAYVYPAPADTNRTTEQVDELLRSHVTTHRVTPLKKVGDGRWTFNVDVFYILLDDIERAMESVLTSGTLGPETREILDDFVLGQAE